MPEIPAEAGQAASAAIERVMREAAHPLSYEEMGRAAAVAAAPFLAEIIASLIEADAGDLDPDCEDWQCVACGRHAGAQIAAKVAREAFPKETPDAT